MALRVVKRTLLNEVMSPIKVYRGLTSCQKDFLNEVMSPSPIIAYHGFTSCQKRLINQVKYCQLKLLDRMIYAIVHHGLNPFQ